MKAKSEELKAKNYNLSFDRLRIMLSEVEALKLKIKSFTLYALVLSSTLLALRSANTKVLAVMRSNDYELQMPNLNFSAGNVSSTEYKLGFTGGQNAPGLYTSTGYKVMAGFWYLKTIIPFSFSVSNTVVDFNTLSVGVASTAVTTLTVSAGGAGGYQVTVQEDHQLLVDSIGAIIPNTTGDNGDITESNPGTWAQSTTYGFGYTMYGNDVPAPFPTVAPVNDSYKQFADISKDKTAQVIMSRNAVGKNRTSTLTYKVNISATQVAGRYHNVITYIATPTF